MFNKRRKRRAAAITPEALESRKLLTAVSLSYGELIIEGTNQNDRVEVSMDGGEVVVSVEGRSNLNFDAGDIDEVTFYGNGGDDHFRNSTAFNAVANGGDGNDTLIGGSNGDILNGNDGNDDLRGRGGRDYIYGNNGDDVLRGGRGNDKMAGDVGNDTLLGGSGSDTMYGGYSFQRTEPGADSLVGGGGNDTMYGSDGDDTLKGSSGRDLMFGGDGADRMQGGDHSDTLFGESGSDALFGNRGNDELYGQDGQDNLNGGDGADKLKGGDGRDTLNGGGFDDDVDQLFGEGGADVFHQWGENGSSSRPNIPNQVHGEDAFRDFTFATHGNPASNDKAIYHKRPKWRDRIVAPPVGPVVAVETSAAVGDGKSDADPQAPKQDLYRELTSGAEFMLKANNDVFFARFAG